MKHSNISIFVPHIGCKHQCTFCNQREITGQQYCPGADDVISAAQQAKRDLGERTKNAEIAFFGGSFTAIKRCISLFQIFPYAEFCMVLPDVWFCPVPGSVWCLGSIWFCMVRRAGSFVVCRIRGTIPSKIRNESRPDNCVFVFSVYRIPGTNPSKIPSQLILIGMKKYRSTCAFG